MNDTRHNNFDALRVYAALMVIYGHGFNITGGIGPGLWGVPFARIGLDIFFAISGYLVTASWYRTPDLPTFLAKRVLRLLPGLAACVVLTALVLGPLVTVLSPERYFTNGNTYKYLANIALYQRLYLPRVFEELHYSGVVNGSLWSLLPEALCYLTVPLFALLPPRPRFWGLAIGAVLLGSLGLWLFEGYTGEGIVFYNADLKYVLVQFPFFFAGALFRLLERPGRELYRADVALLCFTLNWSFASWFSWWNVPLEWFTLPYMVICFGRMSMPVLRRAARFGDLSYGLYLYAFPMQQLVLHLWPGNPYAIPLCVLLTLPLAFLSWHLVEKPALRLKPEGLLRWPGRRRADAAAGRTGPGRPPGPAMAAGENVSIPS
ncbi:acyltransferase family protein [Roseomonas sp. BN140053]|uniref:acyltransferase family protein n=1 Tax=Roseomonas sp. BN140053 TaxID=3391898 RepID=UPI0039ED8BD9